MKLASPSRKFVSKVLKGVVPCITFKASAVHMPYLYQDQKVKCQGHNALATENTFGAYLGRKRKI